MFFKKLKYRYIKAIGRNGKLLCRTKTSFKIKLLFRFIDFYLTFLINNIFIYIKYVNDVSRNSKLILCLNLVGFFFYIIGCNKLVFPKYYNLINYKFNKLISYGQPIKLMHLFEGNFIYYGSFYKNYYAQLCRSAGKFAQIVKSDFLINFVLLKLKNGKKILNFKENFVIYGVINNEKFYNIPKGKAGILNCFGKKMIVRGVAKNPIDHPNGGRTPGGKVYRSYNFKIAKSLKKTNTIRNLFYKKMYF
jgi:large subunit ribosomal protein L2